MILTKFQTEVCNEDEPITFYILEVKGQLHCHIIISCKNTLLLFCPLSSTIIYELEEIRLFRSLERACVNAHVVHTFFGFADDKHQVNVDKALNQSLKILHESGWP